MIRVQLRYSFRLYPSAGQRMALARAFGCARVVYNDALRARETARGEGMPFPKTGDLSKQLITEAKNTPERAWLGEASAVVLQQSLRDLDTEQFAFALQGLTYAYHHSARLLHDPKALEHVKAALEQLIDASAA